MQRSALVLWLGWMSKWWASVRPSASFLKQVSSSGVLAATSAYLSQKLIEQAEHVDPERVFNFTMVTMGIVVPVQYHWFRFLNDRIQGHSLRVALKRMAMDQLIAAPLLTAVFLFSVQLMDSKSVPVSAERAAHGWMPVMTNNYKLWPLVQLVNLSLVPLEYRVVVLQFVGLFWGCYVSYVIGHEGPKMAVA